MLVSKGVAGLMMICVFSSCQSTLKPSGYLGETDSRMTRDKTLPFSRSWKKPGVDLASYSEIAVRPVRTGGLRELGGIGRVNVRNVGEQVRRDAGEIAVRGTQAFKEELGRSPNRRVVVTEKPLRDRGTMLVETNLVELEPGRPTLQVLNFFVPFTGLFNRPSIGLEGRLVDARSGEVLFAFSDLEKAERSLLDVQRFSYYGVQRREVERWAKQLRQVVEGNGTSLVRDAFPIQIVNW